MAVMTFAEATRRALAQEMRRDGRVWVLGEDVRFGGVFGQYAGLVGEFGPDRIVDTPIAESTIMGAGLGAALVGTRPVIEMRIADFVLPAMDELVNQIAKVRYMFGGQARASVVIRMPHGLLPGSAAQHSQTIENWFVNVPGLVVAAPATAADHAGMLISAIRSDDPVILFEAKGYLKQKEDVPDDIEPVPFGVAVRRREGRDVTVVTWSQGLKPVLEGVDAARQEGVDAEVIDLRSLWPWDVEAVVSSVERTKRLLVVQEGGKVGGFGSEIIATVIERLGPQAIKAVRQIGAPRIPVPFSKPLEAEVTLHPDAIKAAIAQLAKS
ncbi:MAG TPA: transketolase C-terminal domain-containing protein [Hyphomicrobiaceae bacterium]|nr:transketolase C-terminal domain-containing protein [Hyphomicrobiaceae bacterium]